MHDFYPNNLKISRFRRFSVDFGVFFSAGGTGVLINLDRVAGLMSLLAPQVKHVRGIADSGWFLDNKQYKSIECTDVHSCAPVDGVEKGIQ